MTAVGLVARLRAAFDLNIELAMLFERPTISGLAEAIDVLVLTSHSVSSPSSEAREEFEL